LGCLPGRIPVGLKDLTYYAAGALPQAPPKVDVPAVADWGVNGNDLYGDCGVAGINHYFMADAAIAAETESFPPDQDVVGYYFQFTNNVDSGVVLSDFLSYVQRKGFFGHTIAAYAPVSVHDIPTLHFAVNAYGAAYTGIKVTKRMMDSFNSGKPWDLDDLLSPVEGGHCVPIVGYDDRHLYAVTWGKVQPVSHAAWHYMSTEAWGILSGEFVSRGDDNRGINLAALQADLSKVGA
jgi:hypothetical protein